MLCYSLCKKIYNFIVDLFKIEEKTDQEIRIQLSFMRD